MNINEEKIQYNVNLIFLTLCNNLKKFFDFKSIYKKRQLASHNIISLVHLNKLSLLNGNRSEITVQTHMDFVKAYEKMDKDLDIHILIHTYGGSLPCTEVICNCIINHKQSNYKGKIFAYIPYYAYSGGCMIALVCDKIIMSKYAILGQCDGQQLISRHHSISSIIEAVDYKKALHETINEEWLVAYCNAQLYKSRQLEYINRLIKANRFDEELGKIIYNEFFSGKYNHDKIFFAEEAKGIGLDVEIVDEMPKIIKNIIKNTIK